MEKKPYNGYESQVEQPINKNLNRKENGLCPCDCPNCDSENCIDRKEWEALNPRGRGIGRSGRPGFCPQAGMGKGPGAARMGRGLGRKDKVLKSTSIGDIEVILEEFNQVKGKCPTAKMIEIKKTHMEGDKNKFTLIYVVNKEEFDSM